MKVISKGSDIPHEIAEAERRKKQREKRGNEGRGADEGELGGLVDTGSLPCPNRGARRRKEERKSALMI